MVWLPLGQHLIDLRLNMLHMHCILHNYAPRFTRLNTLIFVRTQPCVSFFVSLTDPPPPLLSIQSPLLSNPSPPSSGIPPGRSLRKFGHQLYHQWYLHFLTHSKPVSSICRVVTSVSNFPDRWPGQWPTDHTNELSCHRVSPARWNVLQFPFLGESLFFFQTRFFFPVAFDLSEDLFGANIVPMTHSQTIRTTLAP